jgi:tRNA C32,U32 (ribose-2'-O)-methylase TrmJ
MDAWKDNISFVLVEPGEPGNIGAAAPAMKNMGFKTLELVKPVEFLTNEARQMTYHSTEILEKAKVYSRFRDAIGDKNVLVCCLRPMS